MTEREVPRERTSPTITEWRDAMLAAGKQIGLLLAEDTLAVLYAQWALETGRGKSCFNFNLGNIRHFGGDGRDWMWLQTFEYIGGKRVDGPGQFRAFGELITGALDYLRFLSRASYLLAWTAALRGDPTEFARALKVLGYYTAPLESYATGLRGLVAEYYRAIVSAKTIPADPTPTRRETPSSKSQDRMQAVREPVELGDPNAPADPIWRAPEAEHEVPLDDTTPGGGWSLMDFAEELLETLRGTLVCHTCEDPPAPKEAA